MSHKHQIVPVLAVILLLALVPPTGQKAVGGDGTTDADGARANCDRGRVAWAARPVEGQSLWVTGEKAAYACGEPIFLIVHLKNNGTRPVVYPRSRLRRPRIDYSLDVSLPSGRSVAIATTVKAAMNGGVSEEDPDGATLKPGEEFAQRIPLNAYHDFGRAGKYAVSARLNVAMPEGGFSATEAVSNKLQINVVDVVAEQLEKQGEELKKRRTLNFSKTWITDQALEKLDGLTKLEELRLFAARNITDTGLGHLKRLPALEWLDVSGTRITDAALKDIERFVALKTLDLSQTKITDAGLDNLRGANGLQILGLDDDAITDAGLEHLGELIQLRTLSIGGTRVSGTGLRFLKPLSNLDSLSLGDTRVGDAGLEHLKGLVKLQWLDLGNTAVTDAGLEHLKALTNLERLGLGDTSVTDAGLKHLAALTKLEQLDLGRTRITDAGLVFVKSHRSLNSLYVGGDAITDTGLENLKEMTQLSEFCLAATQITDAGLARLQGLKNLYWLELSKTRVTADGVKKLKQALPKCVINVSNY